MLILVFNTGLLWRRKLNFLMQPLCLRLHLRCLVDLNHAGELSYRFAPACASSRIPLADLHDSPEPQLATKSDNDEFQNDVSERISRTQEISLPST